MSLHNEETEFVETTTSSAPCDDILNALRRYPQRPATISSTPCDDILIFRYEISSTTKKINKCLVVNKKNCKFAR